mgnify:CR=1 FL=1
MQLKWKANKFDFELFSFNQCDENVGIIVHDEEQKQLVLKKISGLNKIIVDDGKLEDLFQFFLIQMVEQKQYHRI